MYYFGDFRATYGFALLCSLLATPAFFFKNVYKPYCYKTANTPILPSHNPHVSFLHFSERHSQLCIEVTIRSNLEGGTVPYTPSLS